MARRDKRLEQMRRNPRDWRIADVEALCASFGLRMERPPSGSHFGVKHPASADILTIPADRPIKPVYIRRLVKLVDQAIEWQASQGRR